MQGATLRCAPLRQPAPQVAERHGNYKPEGVALRCAPLRHPAPEVTLHNRRAALPLPTSHSITELTYRTFSRGNSGLPLMVTTFTTRTTHSHTSRWRTRAPVRDRSIRQDTTERRVAQSAAVPTGMAPPNDASLQCPPATCQRHV